MLEVNECISCGHKKLKQYKAAVAPFLAARIWNKKPFGVNLTYCKSCGFTFFNPRLEENEVNIYYKDYRQETYQQQRNKFEPFYTKELNDLIGNDIEIVNRKNNLSNLLNQYTDINKIKSILDFGGDRGQFIIDELAPFDRYVFDISESKPIDNIVKIDNLEECKKNKYDLIMCAHVLEHTSFPVKTIEVLKSLSNKDTIIYLEVPLENPFYYSNAIMRKLSKIKLISPILFNITEILKKRNVLNINSHTNSFNINSLKQLFTSIPSYIKRIIAFRKFFMHEHVNYFTPESLTAMMQENGFKDIMTKTATVNCGWANHELICCFARLNEK